MQTWTRVVGWWLIVVLCVTAVQAQKRPRIRVWGVPTIYSNLGLEPETGDVGGMEVILIPAYSGEWASVIIADGVPNDPVLVQVNRDGSRISFTLPNAAPYQGYGTFRGTITRAGLELRNELLGAQVLKKQCR